MDKTRRQMPVLLDNSVKTAVKCESDNPPRWFHNCLNDLLKDMNQNIAIYVWWCDSNVLPTPQIYGHLEEIRQESKLKKLQPWSRRESPVSEALALQVDLRGEEMTLEDHWDLINCYT